MRKHIVAFAVAFTMASSAAFAADATTPADQSSKTSGATGGTDSRDGVAQPTADECAAGFIEGKRWTKEEFAKLCIK